ncbi:hypothetical protein B0H12DRAFT_525195 [Mycena haematopus]|nr:hypothetical protein B0H12DRAFT_525195 [Mycena haematopus]
MAPTFGTTFVMPPVGPYPTFTRLFEPTPTPSAAASFIGNGVNFKNLSRNSATAAEVFLFVTILLGIGVIAWLCFRRRTRVTSPQAVGRGLEHAPTSPKIIEKAQITSDIRDSSQPEGKFWGIGTAQTKTNDALLSEPPHAWRLLGRPNAAELKGLILMRTESAQKQNVRSQ